MGRGLGWQDQRQIYDRILVNPPYVRPRSSTPNSAVELEMEYRQQDPRNRRHSMTAHARAWQLEQRWEDIDAAIHKQKELRFANKGYFNQAANLRAEDLQIVNLAVVHETKMEQSHGDKLDARWRGPYWVTDIAQSLGTDWLAERDGAELVG